MSSDRVSPYALLEARWVIDNMMINRVDVLQAIGNTNTRLVVMATDEFTTHIPIFLSMLILHHQITGTNARAVSAQQVSVLP